ncbi:MAG TPA: hypothetical protein ENL01_04140 [Chlorobaculum parvum]|uniref:Uncharacterized protein n=1 Tax=Chlorobaculum parvum TaxID=274539 RepID=A0A7C5HFX5_9CHLB|nr:hypothetical protein [Chlorobaculum parvum]
MESEAVLKQLGYAPNEALMEQIERIEANTAGYDKIQKHILDLHEQLKVDDSFIALSNSHDYFKIKVEAPSEGRKSEALERVHHFADKYKIAVEKVPNADTYYIKGFAK